MYIILISLLFGGCAPASHEINTLGIVISIGIDKAEEGYMVTYQVLNPKAIVSASQKSTNESPVIIYTQKGSDLFEIKRKITEESPRKMYFSHLRSVVISEEVAQEGILTILDFFTRGHEFRTDFYFLIACGTTANHLLSAITPLEPVSGLGIYDSLEISEKNWAPIKAIKILEIVNDIMSEGKNPVLTGVEYHEVDNNSNSLNSLKQSTPTKIKFSRLGAFANDKLVGWLSEYESKGYNYISSDVKSTVEYIAYDDHNRITFEVIQLDSKTKVYLLDDEPAIKIEINLKANISAVTSDIDLTDEDIVDKVRVLIEEKIEGFCYAALSRSQDDLGTDIFGFGEEIHKKYPKLWKNISKDWNNVFGILAVNVDVKVEINKLGQNTKPIFSKGN
jgi:spore germination protein KC